MSDGIKYLQVLFNSWKGRKGTGNF